jgi:uracil-DNA glycosylase family protein
MATRARRAVAGKPTRFQSARSAGCVPTRGITGSAADFIPVRPTIPKMRAAAQGCRGCALYACATQAVFGEGPRSARVLVIGEQPGDEEDKQGKPFVGPSGKLLDRAFGEAGIARDDLYLTNAVKHFKWAREAGGKRRIHKTPSAGEVRACFPWLEMEIKLLQPDVIVCLGATAAKALLGKTFSVMKSRGQPIESQWAPVVITTVHPSAVLRAPRQDRERAMDDFLSDLKKVGVAIRKKSQVG